jgi:anti-anti-sigma factor
MASTLAEATVRIDGDTAIVELTGDINRAAEPALTGAYEEISRAGSKKVVLNFEGTEFINSTGIAVIVGILARARQEERSVSACGLTEHYQHIFQITRLADFMPMFPDESAALANAS